MNLYDLSNNYKNLVEVLDNIDLTDDLKAAIAEELNSIEDTIYSKADNIVRFIKNLDAEAKAIKEEEKILADKRKAIENKAKNLERYLFDFTSLTEKKEIKGGIFTVSIKKNPHKVNIIDQKLVPLNFIKFIEEVDKTSLKKALKNGEIIEGAELIQEESLKIK